MKTIIVIYLVGYVLWLLWYAVMRAPVGYEDEDGFHYGEE